MCDITRKFQWMTSQTYSYFRKLGYLKMPARHTQVSTEMFNLSKPTGHVTHQQFNIQQLYALPTLYLCVLYLSENKQRLVPLTA